MLPLNSNVILACEVTNRTVNNDHPPGSARLGLDIRYLYIHWLHWKPHHTGCCAQELKRCQAIADGFWYSHKVNGKGCLLKHTHSVHVTLLCSNTTNRLSRAQTEMLFPNCVSTELLSISCFCSLDQLPVHRLSLSWQGKLKRLNYKWHNIFQLH